MSNIWEIFNISGVAACVIFIFSAARFLYFFLPASSEDAFQAFLPAYSCNILIKYYHCCSSAELHIRLPACGAPPALHF